MTKIPYEINFVINYLRKSRQDEEREKRTGEDTLSEQKSLMDRVLSQYDGIIYDQKFEIGSGDKIETRPVFKEVLDEIEQGKYDAIAVKEISRLGRGSYTDMGKIYDIITQKRIYIITPWKIYDPKNSADLRQIRFELFLSREEFETIRERLVGAKYSYAMQGKWIAGSVPYGYKFDEKTQKLTPNGEEAKIVKLLYELYVNGYEGRNMGFRALATFLTRKLAVPTPKGKKEWHPQTIHRMLQKRVYIGEVSFRKTERINGKQTDRPEEEWIIVADAHEPLIDVETFEKTLLKMSKKENNPPRNPLDFTPCELASVVTCGTCGRKMIRQYSVQHYQKQSGYESVYHKEFLWCPTENCSSVKYRDVESQLLSYLEYSVNISDERLNEVLQNSMNIKSSTINRDEMVANLQSKINELNKKRKFIFDQYENEVYTKDIFMERKNSVEKEIADIQNSINEIISNNVDVDDSHIDIINFREKLQNILSVYNTLQKQHKNELLREVFEYVGVNVIEKGRGRRSAKFELNIRFADKILV